MTRFITLAGKKQVGKDTSAGFIKNIVEHANPGVKVHIAHFADALKEACTSVFGIPRSDMESETGKKRLTDVRWPKKLVLYDLNDKAYNVWLPDPNGLFMTVREVLQYVGTEMFRSQMDPDLWVKSIFRRQYGPDDIVVVADCRFPNEADYAKKNGLLVSVQRSTGLEGDQHASEIALDSYEGYHVVIENNGSFAHLRTQWLDLLQMNSLA